jgi:transposase
MKAYAQDVRERVLRAVDHGYPSAEIVQMFGSSLSTRHSVWKATAREGAYAAESDPWSSFKETSTGGGWHAAPVTGARRCHPGTTR